MNMFREILRAQWKWAGGTALLCAVAAFAIPILSMQNTTMKATANSADIVRALAAVSETSTLDAVSHGARSSARAFH